MIKYSVIIPSRGDRPKALGLAIDHIMQAGSLANLIPDNLEILVGFDGVKGEKVRTFPLIKYFNFPKDNDFGNALRHGLLKATKGQRVIFNDDDNILLPTAFLTYEKFPSADMLIARIDTSKAFDVNYLPRLNELKESNIIRPGNIDPLCLCLSLDLVLTSCGGWAGRKNIGTFQYESDFFNILSYYRRAKQIKICTDVVGVYDAGCGLDESGLNLRQKNKK